MGFFKRILGIVISLVSILGIVVGVGGAVLTQQGVPIAQDSVSQLLSTVVSGIDPATETIMTVRNTIEEASRGLETVERSAVDMAFAITSTEPVLDEVRFVLGESVPASIETVQTALPNLIEVAGTVDQALQTLSNFGVNEAFGGTALEIPDVNVLGRTVEIPDVQLPTFPLIFDLGIEYNPETAFDQSLVGIEQNLEGIPESMRALGSGLEDTTVNIVRIGENVSDISENLNAINRQVALLPGQIDAYVDAVEQTKASVASADMQVRAQIGNVAIGITVLFVWFALIQLAPLYIGLCLAMGWRID